MECDDSLREILLKPIRANERTRRYQESLDRAVDEMRKRWDLDRGLLDSRGIDLPHERISDYWEMPPEERARLTSPEAAGVYSASAGRSGTHPLAVAAFAWHSPLSRHHRAQELVRFFENGLDFFTRSIRRDGAMAACGLNGERWAHGWDVEGLIYGLILLWDEINPDVRERALGGLRRSAGWFLERESGAHSGNQTCVHALGLWLYGKLFHLPEMIRAADARWAEIADNVLDPSGQVVEQYGPCMHYSYTAFIYAWLNCFLRNGDGREEQIERCLNWFRHRHTESLYPFAGPSARQHVERLVATAVDIIPACEHIAGRNPLFQRFADKIWRKLLPENPSLGGVGHGASPMMWAILASSTTRRPVAAQRAAWNAPFEQYYEWIRLFGRSPLKYLLVKREYQTHFNFRDFLPFSGIQTWAFGKEPPIIHPTILWPSTTQGWGLDTARQGVSHNWGLFGAGCLSCDGRYMPAKEPEGPSYLVARYDKLWRIVVFTQSSTVLLEFGDHGPRKTFWTLNRLEPAEPRIAPGVVSFEGRIGRIYSTSPQAPLLREMEPEPKVRVLEYECGDGFCAFAFSDDSFRFEEEGAVKERVFRFRDRSGSYRVLLSAGFFASPNPGNCSRDVWHLAAETLIERS